MLLIVQKQDYYGYELVEEVSKIVDVNEGTIYPILKRLTNEKYFDTYLEESNEGPIRKYYHITSLGIKRCQEQKKEWEKFANNVNEFIKRSERK